eukprot:scaffold9.g3150.t1
MACSFSSAIGPRAIALLLLMSSCEAVSFKPGETAQGLSIPTLSGRLTIQPPPSTANLPLLIGALDRSDAASRHMWTDPDSLAALLERLPASATCLFLSYSGDPLRDAEWMRGQLLFRGLQLGWPRARLTARLAQLHFATQPAHALAGGAAWLSDLLSDWRSPRRVVAAVAEAQRQQEAGRQWPLPRQPRPQSALLQQQRQQPLLLKTSRLDASYNWIPWPATGIAAPLVHAGTGCAWEPRSCLNGSVALITLLALPAPEPAECTYAVIARRAEAVGAVAVLFAAPPGSDVVEVDCFSDAECAVPIGIPVSMVSAAAGRTLAAAAAGGGGVTVDFGEEAGPGLFAGVDHRGRLVELGWQKFPSLQHLVWAAQWQDYLERLDARLESTPARVVPVLQDAAMAGEHGVHASVRLPAAEELEGWDALELEMALSCPGDTDAGTRCIGRSCHAASGAWDDLHHALDCPIWDHVVQLFVCCEGQELPCDACQPTVWAPGQPRSSARGGQTERLQPTPRPGGAAATGGAVSTSSDEPPTLRCGRELGRWITPFRRRVGRWLTDVTPLAPLLLPGRTCNFTMQSTAWSGEWRPSLNLRFTCGSRDCGLSGARAADAPARPARQPSAPRLQLPPAVGAGASAARPALAGRGGAAPRLRPLPFSGGTFDARYNLRIPTFEFHTPPFLERALVVSFITGHGSDENGCGEFCPTSHQNFVNGRALAAAAVNFSAAGTLWGCADRALLLPHGCRRCSREWSQTNMASTWPYGRAGWCDGQDVKPLIFDITPWLHRHGGPPNLLAYRGLFRGADPAPQQQPGYIMMQARASNLVLYTAGDPALPAGGGTEDEEASATDKR